MPRKRVYHSALRAEQADQTRRRLLDAAAACFAEHGYAGTTMKAIAERAGVSVETVQLNGPKAALLLASYEQSFAGDEGQHSLLDRDVFRPVLAMTNPDDVINAIVDFMTSAHVRSGRVAAALDAAALSDPTVAVARAGLGERARADARAGVDRLAAADMIRSTRPRKELSEELWFLLRPSHYLMLVEEVGWSERRYKAWLRRSLHALLLEA
ncbi:MAG: hypothetical protein JWL70_892 [Acidimicrobiia bacterium]|nr:hypothetical protein [Acidimicrobiia bacterium]